MGSNGTLEVAEAVVDPRQLRTATREEARRLAVGQSFTACAAKPMSASASPAGFSIWSA